METLLKDDGYDVLVAFLHVIVALIWKLSFYCLVVVPFSIRGIKL